MTRWFKTNIQDTKIKKKGIMLFAIIFVAILMVGMLVSCTTVEDDTNTPPLQEEPNNETEKVASDASPTIKTDSGSYVGQVDNNSIEIRISGVQDDKLAFKVFKISDEVRSTFESLALKKDDEVKFDYYEETIGQPVISKIEKISN